jgi:predicted dinucleotide-binding enzyme
MVFPSSRTVSAVCPQARQTDLGSAQQIAADRMELAAPEGQVSYHSPVCSNTEDAIDRVAAAIDQLASDAQDAKGSVDEGELTTRIATLWQMVSDLDPELARRAQGYTRQAGGDPSA